MRVSRDPTEDSFHCFNSTLSGITHMPTIWVVKRRMNAGQLRFSEGLKVLTCDFAEVLSEIGFLIHWVCWQRC